MSLAEAIRQWQRKALCKSLCERGWCSWPWAKACVGWNDADSKWDLVAGILPPGGETTLMRECPACQRACPPSIQGDATCCDCEAEGAQRTFWKWALSRERRALLPDLSRRWWRSAISYADFMDRPSAGLLGGLCLEQYGGQPRDSERGSPIWSHSVGEPLMASDELPQTNNVTDPRLAVEIAQRRLDPPKKEEGVRAPGCQVVLLAESAEKLYSEIAYYLRKGRAMPSARRYSRHNPYLPAPEDHDSDTVLSEDRDPPRHAIDVEDAGDWG